MNKLLLHPVTRQQLDNFLLKPSHTLALIAPKGSGKGAVANELASRLLEVPPNKLTAYPYFRKYLPENHAISIAVAREIIGFIKLKTAGKKPLRRVVIIEEAQTLTTEAQNALLKTLEEPPSDTVIIVTLTDTTSILPTILSRLQTITLQQVEKQSALEYFVANNHDVQQIERYFLMSGGLAGLTHTLLVQNEDHVLVSAIREAKRILQADGFERLVMVDNIVKQKSSGDIVAALCTVSRSALYKEANRKETRQSVLYRWAKVLEVAEEAKGLLAQNAQAKLVLTNLFLRI